jgi:hypothetical protein
MGDDVCSLRAERVPLVGKEIDGTLTPDEARRLREIRDALDLDELERAYRDRVDGVVEDLRETAQDLVVRIEALEEVE